jgi:hypothetical protein
MDWVCCVEEIVVMEHVSYVGMGIHWKEDKKPTTNKIGRICISARKFKSYFLGERGQTVHHIPHLSQRVP